MAVMLAYLWASVEPERRFAFAAPHRLLCAARRVQAAPGDVVNTAADPTGSRRREVPRWRR
jgi:hypothetical protein